MKLNIKKTTMELLLKREPCGKSWMNGKLYINGVYFCDTIEDRYRGLTSDMPLETILDQKVYGATAIPSGIYKVTLDVVSPKFSKYPFYQSVCQGKLPRLLDVKGFDGILIHVADGPRKDKLLEGCIGIGDKQSDGSLLNGKEVFREFYGRIKNETDIIIEIK